jgi:hypothetical protein
VVYLVGFMYTPDWGRHQSVPWYGSLSTDFLPTQRSSHRPCILGRISHWRQMHLCRAHWQYLAHCCFNNIQTKNSFMWENPVNSCSTQNTHPDWNQTNISTVNAIKASDTSNKRGIQLTNLCSVEPNWHNPIWEHTLIGSICTKTKTQKKEKRCTVWVKQMANRISTSPQKHTRWHKMWNSFCPQSASQQDFEPEPEAVL